MSSADSSYSSDSDRDSDSELGSESSSSHDDAMARYLTAVKRDSVRSEIVARIERYRHSTKRPPFSAAEMTVMAILCSDKHALTRAEILRWILSTFKYYGGKLVDDYLAGCSDESMWYDEHPSNLGPIVDSFEGETFYNYDVPLREAWPVAFEEYDEFLDGDDIKGTYETDIAFTVSPSAGRIFLAKRLAPRRKKVFPFLRLPAELRNAIYEMVLAYPKSGFSIAPPYSDHPREPRLTACERIDGTAPFTNVTHRSAMARKVQIGPMNEVLALLTVCKQLYDEAMPIFYSINTFCFENPSVLAQALSHLPEDRLRHVTSVEVKLCDGHFSIYDISLVGMDQFVPATRALSQLRALKELRIESVDSTWLEMAKGFREKLGRKTKFTKIEQIAGFVDLAAAAAKAEKVEFFGECPLTKAFIEGEREKLQAGVEPKKLVKKRVRKGKEAMKSNEKVEGSDAEVETRARRQKRGGMRKAGA